MKKSFIKNLATCFGLGDMPKAPGTFGTLGGIPIYIGMLFLRKVFPNHMLYNSFYFMFLMTFFVVAVYVSDISLLRILLYRPFAFRAIALLAHVRSLPS